MATVEEAVAAIAQLNGTELQGREIEVREDRFAAESSGSGRVFVGNVSQKNKS